MRGVLFLVLTLVAVSASRAEDAVSRLRNASANELCWDTTRGIAREKYAGLKLGDASLTEINMTRVPAATPIKQSRKDFPGIRTC